MSINVMPRWEYEVVAAASAPSEAALNTALNLKGEAGWEIYQVLPVPGAGLVFFMKRRKSVLAN